MISEGSRVPIASSGQAVNAGGALLNVLSVASWVHGMDLGVYGATKHAVGLLAGVMAREWGEDGISVNHVGPGWVDTEMVAKPLAAVQQAGQGDGDQAGDRRPGGLQRRHAGDLGR